MLFPAKWSSTLTQLHTFTLENKRLFSTFLPQASQFYHQVLQGSWPQQLHHTWLDSPPSLARAKWTFSWIHLPRPKKAYFILFNHHHLGRPTLLTLSTLELYTLLFFDHSFSQSPSHLSTPLSALLSKFNVFPTPNHYILHANHIQIAYTHKAFYFGPIYSVLPSIQHPYKTVGV